MEKGPGLNNKTQECEDPLGLPSFLLSWRTLSPSPHDPATCSSAWVVFSLHKEKEGGYGRPIKTKTETNKRWRMLTHLNVGFPTDGATFGHHPKPRWRGS